MAKPTPKMADQGAAVVQELPVEPAMPQYEDFATWADDQIVAMRERDYEAIDWDNLIEELEYLKEDLPEKWKSNCARLVQHMLKIAHWDDHDERTRFWMEDWIAEIMDYRRIMQEAVERQTGIKGRLKDLMAKAWTRGHRWGRTSLLDRHQELLDSGEVPDLSGAGTRIEELKKLIPEQCPWTLAELAGCNPRGDGEWASPTDQIWPPEVARRLNRVLGRKFSEKGWVVNRGRAVEHSEDLEYEHVDQQLPDRTAE